MPENMFISENGIVRSKKVKTGCTTCRIRKIKCDERKPACQRCVSTGRTCGGYDLSFRNYNARSGKSTSGFDAQSGIDSKLVLGPSNKVALRDIELLSRYFSTKTLSGADLECDEEARHILEACRTHASIQHAVTSLISLRERFETPHQNRSLDSGQSLGQERGFQQYNMALKSLISALSSEDARSLQSALLCCQIFVSIEQMQGNYDSMARHIIQGLNIMHAHRARPSLDAGNNLISAYREKLPLVDVFVIKLFAAPCGLEQPLAKTEDSTQASVIHRQPARSSDIRAIVPDKRNELKKIAFQVLQFLDCVSRVESMEHAQRLLTHKHTLLMALRSWLVSSGSSDEARSSEPMSLSVMRLFHRILELVLLRSLDCSKADLQLENDRLQKTADDVAERLRLKRNVGSLDGVHLIQ